MLIMYQRHVEMTSNEIENIWKVRKKYRCKEGILRKTKT